MKLLPLNHFHLKKSSGSLTEEPPGALNKAQMIILCKQAKHWDIQTMRPFFSALFYKNFPGKTSLALYFPSQA